MESQVSRTCSHETLSNPHPELDEFSSHSKSVFLQDPFEYYPFMYD